MVCAGILPIRIVDVDGIAGFAFLVAARFDVRPAELGDATHELSDRDCFHFRVINSLLYDFVTLPC